MGGLHDQLVQLGSVKSPIFCKKGAYFFGKIEVFCFSNLIGTQLK